MDHVFRVIADAAADAGNTTIPPGEFLAPLIYSFASSVGYVFPVLLGALAVTGEFRHKTLTPTFLAEPNRSLVLGAMDDAARDELVVLDRLFTHEPFALALPRGDDDFRLVVDRTLSGLYMSGEFTDLYQQWFGDYDANTRTFFMWNTLGE